jgi:hypothetical protein
MIPGRIQITTEISVAHVESGGNTGGGRYFFAFKRDHILVEQRETTLVFALSEDTSKDFIVEALVSSDARGQLSAPMVASDARSASVVVMDTTSYLLNIGLIVHNTATFDTLVCDPQVVCRPKPGP